MKQYREVYEEVIKRLSEYRVYHSECVAKRCVELAKVYKVDKEAAQLIGIVHDIAKEIPNDEKIKYCEEHNLSIDEIERENPGLLHGKIGADIAKREFGFSEDLCSAIKYHTTGKANMSLLDKILYVADMTSDDRKFEEKNYIIELGNKNIDECVKYILKIGIAGRIEQDRKIHLNSIIALNYFMK